MTDLPTIQPQVGGTPNRGPKRIALHLVRVLLFVTVIALIHLRHLNRNAQRQNAFAPIELAQLKKFFPTTNTTSKPGRSGTRQDVLDSLGNQLGHVIQTSPGSDHIIGFSGPTNTLIAFSPDGKIIGLDVLYSGDTRDHVNQVVEDKLFLNFFNGLTTDEVSNITSVDGVSGATLTSFAIAESVINRLSGDSTKKQSLKFPDPITLQDAKKLFKTATKIEQDSQFVSLWNVSSESKTIGSIIRTSPIADNVVGYQGPTDSIVGFDFNGKAVGIAVGKSYDNEPYVSYVREDEYFLSLLNDSSLEKLATTSLEEAEIEGISGATMTSISVASAILATAKKHQQEISESQIIKPKKLIFIWPWRNLGTALVVLFGTLIAFTSLRGNKIIRVCFQLVLILYLGLVNGDLISQAMIGGWAKSGIPWSSAGGLVLLTLAAFLIPIFSKRNVYCTHLCPHGAAQHLLMNRLPWKIKIPKSVSRLLRLVPAILLVWCVVVLMTGLKFSLVDIEPFDAWVFRVAGWTTITIAIVGLVASLFVPMAYCQYGCPTGALLNFFRFNSRSDHWASRDWFAVALVALAIGLLVFD